MEEKARERVREVEVVDESRMRGRFKSLDVFNWLKLLWRIKDD